ncbi:hypothetical protein B0J11DRAFT_510233 [Dendryphion nanum]|uniref:Uncharacterized protein n=1 Tax=Dendryphion nanum TaxID=256645 RepID=A0A9P9DAM8_9PLEO|nr:hypothetical protein B0J11DRAFT_510233 [Dendryphion nanum]
MANHAEKSLGLKPPFRRDLLHTISSVDGIQLKTPLLPATYRNRRHMVRLVSADLHAFLEHELDVRRLNCIHNWLWLVGLPTSPRALHYQRIKKRDIVVTEQLDLHLVWSPSRILIKPLPRFMLSPQFWQLHICPDEGLYRVALGFILSYVALIEREVDFHMAANLNLLPSELTWPDWLALAEEVVIASAQTNAHLSSSPSSTSSTSSLESHVPVNPRFFYGELRLGRLNWIYRLALGKPRGYLSGCTTYAGFIRDNVNSLITLFAYTTIVLSAMQVGLATQWLADDYAFGMASYIFSIFSILAPLSAIGAIIFVLAVLFVINLLRTLRIRGKRRRQGAGV